MSLEQEIREFMFQEGVEEDMLGFAGPGRFDGPPSLDPTYILDSAKSIICFALPYAAEPIYDYFSKKTPLRHNIQLYKGNMKVMVIGRRLAEFLQSKGYNAKAVASNVVYRKGLNTLDNFQPDFSHRYGAYVTGIAAPGISGNAMTKRYGAAVWLATVVTDAVLESSPTMDPRHFVDHMCQGCMVCGDCCPTGMFLMDEEEYSLINGELWPRGKKKQAMMCSLGCGGYHALHHEKEWTTWTKQWIPAFEKEKPDPEKHNMLFQLLRATTVSADSGLRGAPMLAFYSDIEGKYEKYVEDSELLPAYEDLEGETEGEKIRSFANHLSKIMGYPVYDPLGAVCENCAAVCGGSIEENKKRYNMLKNGGLVTYTDGNEPLIVDSYEKAVAQRKAYKYKTPRFTWFKNQKILSGSFSKYMGFPDFKSKRQGKAYFKKLNQRLRAEGKPEYPPFK